MAKKNYNLTRPEKVVAQTEENTKLAIVRNQQSNALAQQLSTPEDVKSLAKLKRRGMPTMVKPESVPVNSVIQGEIVAILNSPKKSIKGNLMHIRHASGTEFTFPITGSIRQALAPGLTEKDNSVELLAKLNEEVGKTIVLKRLPSAMNAEYKKEMFIFDVFTS